MSAPYREVSSRLKRLLTEGRVIEGSLYRSDRGNTPRHQLSDRATGRFRNIYVPADFAEDVAAWSANWAEAKRLLKFLNYFLPLPADDVPKTSLMREFVGGGCYKT